VNTSPLVVDLSACSPDEYGLVGGKASGLAALMRHGFHVPSAFAVTTRAYREHLAHNALADDIERLVASCQTFEDQQRAGQQIQQLFESSQLPSEVEDAVLDACSSDATPLAVRSSATAEDTISASFAGQQETFLWIVGGQSVLQHVLRCWASLFSPQAIAYRDHLQTPPGELAMAVVVQHMVAAEAAGVMMTLDPLTGDRSTITIEAAYGLGAAVVNGEVTPDRFCVDKANLSIAMRAGGDKAVAYRFDARAQTVARVPVERALRTRACLVDDEVIELARLGKRIEAVMGRPQDIEWAIGPGAGGPRDVFLLQARPETIWSGRE
jgi:phosphoenolpyruvate synthase/pyruvate phosphate dikinase